MINNIVYLGLVESKVPSSNKAIKIRIFSIKKYIANYAMNIYKENIRNLRGLAASGSHDRRKKRENVRASLDGSIKWTTFRVSVLIPEFRVHLECFYLCISEKIIV